MATFVNFLSVLITMFYWHFLKSVHRLISASFNSLIVVVEKWSFLHEKAGIEGSTQPILIHLFMSSQCI